MELGLEGRRVLVTGGSKGLGYAISRELVGEGARVAICARNEEDVTAAAGELGVAYAQRADVTDPDDVRDFVARSAAALSGIDGLVNNAGRAHPGTFETLSDESWRSDLDVKLFSLIRCCREVLPHMRAAGGGRIVNISSGTPFRGVPFILHYVTSKGAIVALTRALAKELGKDAVRVNCVAPGFTMSEGVRAEPEIVEKLRDVSVAARTLQRDQHPEDVVGAVVFLAGPSASFITGQTMVIDGGQYFH